MCSANTTTVMAGDTFYGKQIRYVSIGRQARQTYHGKNQHLVLLYLLFNYYLIYHYISNISEYN